MSDSSRIAFSTRVENPLGVKADENAKREHHAQRCRAIQFFGETGETGGRKIVAESPRSANARGIPVEGTALQPSV